MGFLDNAIDKAAPKGNSIAKPLMKVFIAALASGALTRKEAPAAAPRPNPAPTRVPVVCWQDWVDCWKNSRRVATARRRNLGWGMGRTRQSRPLHSDRYSAHRSSKAWPQSWASPKRK